MYYNVFSFVWIAFQMDDIAALAGPDVLDRISTLEKENASLRQLVEELKTMQLQSVDRIKSLENRLGSVNLSSTTTTAAKSAAKPPADDDDVDLFGSESEEEDDAAAQLREKRLAEYAAKKGKKPALIAKSNVILDVKPWVRIHSLLNHQQIILILRKI